MLPSRLSLGAVSRQSLAPGSAHPEPLEKRWVWDALPWRSPWKGEKEAGWALQPCPKSERLPQRWKADSLQWLLIIQSQFVPSRRARSPAKPPLLAARSGQSLPALLQRSIPLWQGFGSWDRLSCPIPERSQIPGTAFPQPCRGW